MGKQLLIVFFKGDMVYVFNHGEEEQEIANKLMDSLNAEIVFFSDRCG